MNCSIINIPIKNENNDPINIYISLLIWVLFDFDFVTLEFIYDLNELFILHVQVFMNVIVPCCHQIAQGVIDHKI